MLLQHGASVDLQSKVSFTLVNPLYKCMTIASHTYHEQNGASSLMVASQNGHVEVVDKSLQHGARVDLQENVCVINPLHTRTTCTSPIKSIQYGWHAVMYASQNGHVIVLERLLQHGARLDLPTQVYIMYIINIYDASLHFLMHVVLCMQFKSCTQTIMCDL